MATKKEQIGINLGNIAAIRGKMAEVENAREARMKVFNGDDGKNLLFNAITARIANSFDPKRPSGRGSGMVDNADFGRHERGWTATELHGDLPEDWRKILTVEDVESRLTALWEDDGGKQTGEGSDRTYTNGTGAMLLRSKGRAGGDSFTLDLSELMKLAEEENPEEK